MTDIILVDNQLDRDTWDEFVAQQSDGHLLQSWGWGDFKAAFGWQPMRVALSASTKIVAAAQLVFRPSPLGPLAYIPKGPVLGQATASQQGQLWAAVHRLARQRRAFVLKVEPEWLDLPEQHERLAAQGLSPDSDTIQPRQTIVIDLTPDPDDVLDTMKSKTRYNIRLAGRKGLVCEPGDRAAVDAFYDIMETTGERDEFGIHTRAYYQHAWELFNAQGRASLWMASYKGQYLAGVMAFCLGQKSWYMYGASSNQHRNLMPTYLAQWQALLWAKDRGCASYDMCGIPDLPEEVLEEGLRDRSTLGDAPPHLWGVYRFKRGFGGQTRRYVGAYQRIYSPLRHRLFTAGLALIKKTRGQT